MNRSESDDCFANLSAELDLWSEHQQSAKLFIRDDDAVEITPELLHLQKMTEFRQTPLLLAVIPKFAKFELGDFIERHPLITPAVHGYSHENHAGKGDKKIELGGRQSVDQVLEILDDAHNHMTRIFGHSLSKILVPPWNRISEDVVAGISDLGFHGVSGFGWKKQDTNICWINTHVDIINWRENASAKSIVQVIGELVDNLQTARQHGFVPIGILTHHLVHTQLSWHMLDELFEYLCGHQNVKWVNADDLIINIDPKLC